MLPSELLAGVVEHIHSVPTELFELIINPGINQSRCNVSCGHSPIDGGYRRVGIHLFTCQKYNFPSIISMLRAVHPLNESRNI